MYIHVHVHMYMHAHIHVHIDDAYTHAHIHVHVGVAEGQYITAGVVPPMHVGVVQYVPQRCQPDHIHEAPLPLPRNPASNEAS